MAQRNSEYLRKPLDLYETPEWVTEALLPHLSRGQLALWEPAAGRGKMAIVLNRKHACYSSDIQLADGFEACAWGWRPGITVPGVGQLIQHDFLVDEPYTEFDGIVTNPPFGREGPKFLRRALDLTKERRGFVAMLFPMDFDAAPGRADLFRDHPAWHKKVVLTKRIVWFAREDGQKEAPSMHHAWYLFDHRHEGPATIAYEPSANVKETV